MNLISNHFAETSKMIDYKNVQAKLAMLADLAAKAKDHPSATSLQFVQHEELVKFIEKLTTGSLYNVTSDDECQR